MRVRRKSRRPAVRAGGASVDVFRPAVNRTRAWAAGRDGCHLWGNRCVGTASMPPWFPFLSTQDATPARLRALPCRAKLWDTSPIARVNPTTITGAASPGHLEERDMKSIKGALTAAAALAAVLVVSIAPAQEKYPSRPVEIIVPWGPGGGADQLARLTAKLTEPLLGTSFPVINTPGATGATGMAKLLAEQAD